jgi:hypothetical protein
MSLTFPTLLGFFLPSSVSTAAIRSVGYVILIASYFLILKFHRNAAAAKTASVVFITYYFSYYAYFNSYYLVVLLLLFDFIKENYLPSALRSKGL